MPPVGFEPTVSAGERPQTHAVDRAAIAICTYEVRGSKSLIGKSQYEQRGSMFQTGL
jgi:hypothetical protein